MAPFTPSEEGPPSVGPREARGVRIPEVGWRIVVPALLPLRGGRSRTVEFTMHEGDVGGSSPIPCRASRGRAPLGPLPSNGGPASRGSEGGRAPPIDERETGEGGCRSDFRHLGMPPPTRGPGIRGKVMRVSRPPVHRTSKDTKEEKGWEGTRNQNQVVHDWTGPTEAEGETELVHPRTRKQASTRNVAQTKPVHESNDDPSKKVENHLHEHHWVEYKRETKKKPVHGRKKTPFIGTVSGAPTKETENQSLIKPKKKSQAYAFFKSIGCILRGKSYAKAKAKRTHEKVEPTIPVSPVNEMFPPSPSSSEHSGLTNEFHLLDSSITDDSVSSYLNTNAQTREGSQALGGGGEVLTKQLVMAKLENFRSAKMSEFYTCGEDPCIRAAWFLNVEQRSARTESSPPESASNKAYLEPSKKECNKPIDKGTHILMVVPGKPSIVIPKLDLSWTISHTVPVVKKKKGILASFVSKLSPEPAWSPKPKVSLPGLVQSTNQELNLPAPAGLQKNKLHRKRSWH
eukprot:scaffold764_cov363-Pavlova_lutheri.AAC.14